jgi:sugar phosphate isomerase/epimerase
MEISISTLPFYPQPLEDILNHITELKVRNCEIINEYPHNSLDLDVINNYDIQLSIHAPLSDVNVASHNERIRNSSIAEIKKSMDLACEVGSEIVVVHPGQMPILGRKLTEKILQYNQESLKECSIYARELGVKMCVENMPDIESLLYKNLDDLEKLVSDIDAYITLDVGHAHNNQFTEEDMLKYKQIRHIHLSDNDGSYDSHQALGKVDGNGIDFKSLFNGLKEINYQGILVVEVEEPRAVKESLNYLKII